MRSPKICRALLELILPNEEIGAIRLKKSDNPLIDNSEIDEGADENLSVETQKTLKLEADAHGVRFDAFVASSKLWADIEMQTSLSIFSVRGMWKKACCLTIYRIQ